MLSATTQGLRDLGQFKKRVAHDYGKSQFSWADFQFINDHIQAIEDRLLEIISNDNQRISDDVPA